MGMHIESPYTAHKGERVVAASHVHHRVVNKFTAGKARRTTSNNAMHADWNFATLHSRR